ncbi:PREDICTED: interferon-induced GTP-binding protein Mx1-like isoform X5 [Acropora digitifera]|uniref:interferon-induced GTP-binding protein Mx1-like isoform X5 n=1 Tax=Acropora digitifera TaxID=70779 RepID=UPI00077AC516|nr:PREDICTED: interferon-induced GTP-binding protein Mx1-like isoform X5 [Acropora digitifera]
MSVPTESPVSKYGHSSEFGAVLDFIQTMISNDTLRQAFNIPHLVMVGRQNMAKTTLINRLIGRYLLPMRRNETANTLQARTTYPIILNLRHDPKTKVEVRCEGVPRVEGPNPTDVEVEQFLDNVSDRLPKEEGTPISKTPVNVTLQGPSLTTLTLVDLPGVHFANDDQRMNHVTQQLVLDYIKRNTKSIIVIVSEVADPTGDSTINLVMTQAEDFKTRTICVLTKPDKLRMEDDMGKKIALNQSSFTLEDGRFIVLKGKDGTDSTEKDWDAEMTQIKEKEWFAGHPHYKDIQHLCGIERAMESMISLLANKMISEIPGLVREMKERKIKVEKELDSLAKSEVPESNEKKGELVMKLKKDLIFELNKLLFNNTSDSKGGEEVRKLFRTFQDDVFKVNPLYLRSDDEIRDKQEKIEGVAAPLGDSSENSQLIERLLYEKYQGMKTVYVDGKESRSLTPVDAPVDQLLPISEALVNKVEKTLCDIVQDATNKSLSKFPALKKAVKAKVVNKIFDTKRDQTIEFIKQYLEMQKMSTDTVLAPIPLPNELGMWDATLVNNSNRERVSNASMISKTMNQMKQLSSKLYPDDVARDIKSAGSIRNDKEIEDMKRIRTNVVRCFNVIKMNVCDTVPRSIRHFFITKLVDGLNSALEKEDLVQFLQEKQEICEERRSLRKKLQGLEQALPMTDEVLEKLLHLSHGPSKGKNLQC